MRGVERVFAVPRIRLAEWLIEEAESLPDLSTTLAEVQQDDVLELDELWSFVLKKSNKRWIWLALCRRTRQIVACVVGDRREETCRRLWAHIPDSYRDCQSFSDFWDAYQKVFLKKRITPLAKTVARPTTSNAGTIHSASDWAASFAGRSLSRSRTTSTKLC